MLEWKYDTKFAPNISTISEILVDSEALHSIGKAFKARPDLKNLCHNLTEKFGANIVGKKVFFTYPSSFEGRSPLHSWAFANGWEAVETRVPAKPTSGWLPTSSVQLATSLAETVVIDNVRRVYLISNDLGLEPILKFARKYGVEIHLIFPDTPEVFPYNSIRHNVDKILKPSEIEGFLLAKECQRGDP